MKEVIKKRKSVNYVNNPDFYASLVKYRDMIKENPAATIPNYIGICISSICNKLATKYNFASYTFRDEMIGDHLEHHERHAGSEKCQRELSLAAQARRSCRQSDQRAKA